ncbi:MAG: glycosyltransferase family 4 protein [Verrucomicrobia bacterium]|nr:glycosyltransferase family 4 protein [Verrucomicrobiota bacterium]
MTIESCTKMELRNSPLPVFASLKRAPRILYLSAYWPRAFPTCGGEWRAQQVGSALRQIGSVETIVVASKPEEEVQTAPVNELNVSRYVPVSAQAQKRWNEKLDWFFNLKRAYPHGVGAGAEATSELTRRLAEFDLIWWENFRVPNMFNQFAWDRSILDIDDLPSSIERCHLRDAKTLRKRLIQLIRVSSWARREKALGKRFSVLVTASEADRKYLRKLGCEAPIHVVQNGFRPPERAPLRRPTTPPRLGFLGPLTFLPNYEGVKWFLKNCWPRIRSAIPDARLRIIGKESDNGLADPESGVDGLGWLPEIEDEIATWNAMIVPIRMGGGTRVKIAQALSLKCPVVSTRFGAYGYNLRDGEEILLTGNKLEFVNACIRMIRCPDLANQLAENGWISFLKNWSWDAIGPRVWDAVEDCLRVIAPAELR